MSSRWVALPVAVAAALGLAACTSTTTGSGTPTTSSVPSAAPSSRSTGATLIATQPCDLVADSVLQQNHLVRQDLPPAPGARSCTWQRTTDAQTPGFVLGVDVRDSQGLADINTGGLTLTDDPVGHHQGKLVQQSSGDTCFVAIGVTPTSRVDVTVSSSDADATRSCALANRFAKVVEPKLP